MSELYGVSRRRLVGEAWFWVIMVLILSVVLALGGLAWRYAIAGPKGQVEAREQILSGSNRIRAYNHFFDICASVQTAEQALQASLDELVSAEKAVPRDPDNIVRIQTNITGLRTTRARAINQYNADASKDYTDGQFLSLRLPYQLDASPYVPGGKLTSCAA